jgi:hypothetical protein
VRWLTDFASLFYLSLVRVHAHSETKRFEGSAHVAHLRTHPAAYAETVAAFLSRVLQRDG